jgi:hypothetical protein
MVLQMHRVDFLMGLAILLLPFKVVFVGNTVLPGSTHPLNTLQPPSPGALVGISSYTWSASDGSLSSTAGSSVSWTAPSSGSVTVSLVYGDACPALDATVECVVDIGAPACEYVYVAQTGEDGPGCGGPANPCRTLSGASGGIAKAVEIGSNHIRMTTGIYNEPNVIVMTNDLIIEGRYQISGGFVG